MVLSFIAGKNLSDRVALGLRYTFEKYYNNADPMCVKVYDYFLFYPVGRVENLTETYRIEELGDSSAEESFDVTQTSNTDISNNLSAHILSCGFKGIANKWCFDMVPKISIHSKNYKNNYSGIKNADYDPDNDNINRYGNLYDKEYYKNDNIMEFELFGYGLGFTGRISREINESTWLRFVFDASNEYLHDDESKEKSISTSILTNDGNVNETSSVTSKKGEKEKSLKTYGFGIGMEKDLMDNIKIAMATILNKQSDKVTFDYTKTEINSTRFKARDEATEQLTILSLPLGIETYLTKNVGIRMGIVEYLIWETETHCVNENLTNVSTSEDSFTTGRNSTWGMCLKNEKIEIDILGLTNLLEIKDLQFSISIKI